MPGGPSHILEFALEAGITCKVRQTRFGAYDVTFRPARKPHPVQQKPSAEGPRVILKEPNDPRRLWAIPITAADESRINRGRDVNKTMRSMSREELKTLADRLVSSPPGDHPYDKHAAQWILEVWSELETWYSLEAIWAKSLTGSLRRGKTPPVPSWLGNT